ncbi:hypothetical protein SAMN04488066_105101 [Halorubrum aquaticum]|uniref:Halobacterial output domain-containing protein n=1 Tax=Halorubrum aquaticum TaxID=387340 RepID=A0A1I3ADC4_9EURY|nr:HalOD1 output domain-containing protein [Halorubrum aquaticum]SFH48074.1 hypothetical protein SAMN04488066_105101 [Halorubrum aquaticum]
MTFDDTNLTEDAGAGESSETVGAAWDGSDLPSTAVVEAVASANGREPLEMPPLYDTLDAEALDGLLTADRDGAHGNVGVSFTYDGAYVWVDSGGTIEVDPDPARSE